MDVKKKVFVNEKLTNGIVLMSIEVVGLLVQDVGKPRSIIFILMRLHAIESNRSSCILLTYLASLQQHPYHRGRSSTGEMRSGVLRPLASIFSRLALPPVVGVLQR